MLQPIDLPFKIRQSSLEDSRCLFRFHKNHVLGLREPDSEASARGTQVHALAKRYVDYLVASGQEYDWSAAETLSEGADHDSASLFKDWYQRKTFEPSRIFATEYKIRLDWNLRPCDDSQAVFSADLDRLEIVDAQAEIVDYKSNWAAFNPTTIQAVMYPWMLWKIMPHLEHISFTLDFMRYGIERTREFGRTDLQNLDRYVENQVGRLVEAYKNDAWPASVNSKCTFCRHECPLVKAGLTRESIGQIQSSAQAQALAQQLFALKRAYDQTQAMLRAYSSENGPILAGNDILLGFTRQEQYEYDVRTVMALNEEHGFPRHRGLKVGSKEVAKIGRVYPEYRTRAQKTSKDRSRTVFTFWNDMGDPLDFEDDDGFD